MDKNKIEALEYHSKGRPGKIEVIATKECVTAKDLSLAYSPGVAHPCLDIAANPDDVYKYTAKGNLVAVISNGTAVLGLGDIGPLASKPVMEGKGVLFKKFADVDVFDIEVNETTVEGMIAVVKALEPTFGGINLEDIKAPECFEIEERLKEMMNIPVFHDDQHGTAIIASAAFINALEITKKDIKKVKVVFSGAGAAAIACANLMISLGVDRNNLTMCDSKGVIHKGRDKGMNKYKDAFALDTKNRTLADALDGADAFIGCSMKGLVTKAMVKSMNKDPIIFAMANPDPEIMPEEVAEVRNDAIMATGRTDYPNQVNNVLGFPFIFRGALDVRATKINEDMKLAAVYALSELAKEEVPEEVKRAYGNKEFVFGKNYLIPKPFDKRALTRVSPAVAKAAMDSGVARVQIDDLKEYARYLEGRLGHGADFMRSLRERAHSQGKARLVFPEGNNQNILVAVSELVKENIIEPIILGKPEVIKEKIARWGIEGLDDVKIICPEFSEYYPTFVDYYHSERQRKGASLALAKELMMRGSYFGPMLVREGYADGMITGANSNYPECIKPIMRVVGEQSGKSSGISIAIFKHKILFLADCTAQVDPDSQDLAMIASNTAELFQRLMLRDPRIAFLSYSSFGSNRTGSAKKVSKAVELAKEMMPNLQIDGEMQADVAVNHRILSSMFSFAELDDSADILIFPELNSANITYKILRQLADCTVIGPILVPLNHSINIVQRTATIQEIIDMSVITSVISKQLKCIE